MKLKCFQLWFNDNTGELYESRPCKGGIIMYTSIFGAMFMNQGFINNPRNKWVYVGELN